MTKLRILYILSMILLGLLVAFAVFRPLARGERYSEVVRMQLLKEEDEWIIQFAISNHEGRDTKYTINITVDGKRYDEQFLVKGGGTFTYVHHISRDAVGNGEVTSAIYKEGEDTPLDESTFYLK